MTTSRMTQNSFEAPDAKDVWLAVWLFAMSVLMGSVLLISEGDPWGALILLTLCVLVALATLALYAERYVAPQVGYKWPTRVLIGIGVILTGWYANSEALAALHSLVPMRDADVSSALLAGRFLYFSGALVVGLPIAVAGLYFSHQFRGRQTPARNLRDCEAWRTSLTNHASTPYRGQRGDGIDRLKARIRNRIGPRGVKKLAPHRRWANRDNVRGVLLATALMATTLVAALLSVGKNDSLVKAVMADMLYSADAFDPKVFPCGTRISLWLEQEQDAGRKWRGFRQGAGDVLFVRRSEDRPPQKPYWRYDMEEIKQHTHFEMQVHQCFVPAGGDDNGRANPASVGDASAPPSGLAAKTSGA